MATLRVMAAVVQRSKWSPKRWIHIPEIGGPLGGGGKLKLIDGSGSESGSVGVGTGGAVIGGSGSLDASVGGTEDVAMIGAILAGADDGAAEGAADGDTVGVAVVEARAGTAAASGGASAALVCRAGASPMPPAPAGASIAADRLAGVASCQPIVTATGRPRATSPKKMDLGDNRT